MFSDISSAFLEKYRTFHILVESDGHSFMSLASLGGVVPCILIIISYTSIYIKVWKTGKY